MRRVRVLGTLITFILSGLLATAATADALGDWRKAVAKKVSENQVYPRSALAREIEGRAVLLIKVSKDGTIFEHKVLQPTGEQVLDREIPKLVKRVSPLPALPAGENDASLVLPLTWSIN